MSLQKYVRQVNPRNESYISPVDKVQNFLTEAVTTGATYAEMAICYEYNLIRSDGDMDVSKISAIYNGGGHKGAAGFDVKSSYSRATCREILDLIKREYV